MISISIINYKLIKYLYNPSVWKPQVKKLCDEIFDYEKFSTLENGTSSNSKHDHACFVYLYKPSSEIPIYQNSAEFVRISGEGKLLIWVTWLCFSYLYLILFNAINRSKYQWNDEFFQWQEEHPKHQNSQSYKLRNWTTVSVIPIELEVM